MKLEASGRVYLVYNPHFTVINALRLGGMFQVRWLVTSTRGQPNAELVALRDLASRASERGDIVYGELFSAGGDSENPEEWEQMERALTDLLQIPMPPHESVRAPDGTEDVDLQPLQEGETLVLFLPYYDADEVRDALLYARTPARVGQSQLPDEPPPMAKPANVSSFEVVVIQRC